VRSLVRDSIKAMGRVDILVNAAGVSINKSFLDHEPQDFDQVMDTNLRGTWNTTQAVARRLVAAGEGGAVVNIASIFGHRVAGHAASYCASKAAVLHLTQYCSLR